MVSALSLNRLHQLLFCLVVLSMIAGEARAAIVINEVYLGRGNPGDTYKNEYVELFNNSPTVTQNIGNYAVEYESATGPATTIIITITPGTLLGPLDYFVFTNTSGGSNGIAVPNVDQAAGPASSFSSVGGKLRLRDSSVAATVIDLIGWGTANASEGSPAPTTPIFDRSIQRYPNGVDTNQNSIDFTTDTPTPGTTNLPEPTSAGMLSLGAWVLLRSRRKNK